MISICFVNGVFPPKSQGGAENYVLRTATELQRRGHDVAVVTTCPYDGISSLRPSKSDFKGVPVWRFYPLNHSHRSNGTGGNPLTKAVWHQLDTVNPHATRAVGTVLDKVEPDIVHTNNLMGISTGVSKAIRERDIQHVHTLHDYSLICPKSNLLRDWTAPDDDLEICENPPVPCRLYGGQKRRALGTPDVVTGPSQHVIDVHRKHGYFEDTRHVKIPLGVESVAADPPGTPREPSVLYAGEHLRAKGLETLFEAADRLSEVQFYLCGDGPFADESEKRAGRQENVTYLGYVSAKKLNSIRRRVSVGVVPSIWMENSPLTIYESYAVGLPVIGSKVGGIPELIEPGMTGRLFDAKNASALSSDIAAVVSNTETLLEMQTNALEWADTHRMDDHIHALFEQAYKPA